MDGERTAYLVVMYCNKHGNLAVDKHNCNISLLASSWLYDSAIVAIWLCFGIFISEMKPLGMGNF